MTTIRKHIVDDETIEYYLNDNLLVCANHDSHGWAGMELADDLVAAFAAELGITIDHTYYEGEDE